MKNSILIIFLLFFLTSFGQATKEFNKTTEYYLTEIDSITRVEYWKNFPIENEPKPISIYLKDRKEEKLFEIKVSGLESYSGTSIEVLEINTLKNIVQIIHLKSDYNACCSNYYSIYLLKTKNGELIKLPETDYLHCDGPTPIIEYRFPNQKFGKENQILMTKSFLNDKYKVESIEIQKAYLWNGKTFELEK